MTSPMSGKDKRPKKKPTTSKKSMNFDLCSVEIGPWKKVAEREGMIVGKCFFAEKNKHLVWEFLPVSDQKKVRIKIEWTKIIAASYSEPDGGNGLIEIELKEKPRFEEEKNVNSKHSSYQDGSDFTGGYASLYRRHRIEIAPHIYWRNFPKLKEDNDTPLCKPLTEPFKYGPSSTFEAEKSIVAPEPMAPKGVAHESTPWFDHHQLISEPSTIVQAPTAVHGSTYRLYPSFASCSRTPQPVDMVKRVKLEHYSIPPSNAVHDTTHWLGCPCYQQQTEDSGSWTQGPVLPQQTKHGQTIPNYAVCETTDRFYPPFQPQQTEDSGSWTQGPILPQQTELVQTIPNAVHETSDRIYPPFQPQQTEVSSLSTSGPVLTHQPKPEPTIPNAVHETIDWFDPPFQPQQTEVYSSWPQMPVSTTNMVHQIAPWSGLPFHPSFWTQGPSMSQPRFDFPPSDIYQYQTHPDPTPYHQELGSGATAGFLPSDTSNLDPVITDPSIMTFQGLLGSNYNCPTGLDSVQQDRY